MHPAYECECVSVLTLVLELINSWVFAITLSGKNYVIFKVNILKVENCSDVLCYFKSLYMMHEMRPI